MKGLILAGGGAKGAYQIGAWKAFIELGIEFDLVCGTSIGAFNGAFYAQKQFDVAFELWNNMTMDELFNADENVIKTFEGMMDNRNFSSGLAFFKDLYGYVKEKKGLDISPLREKVDIFLDEELLRASDIMYGLVTVNLDKFKPLRLFADEIPEGELKYYLLGSAMVPGFARETSHPIKFMDGGVYDNLPIKMAVERKCDEIVAVCLSHVRKKKFNGTTITYIEPSGNLGNFLHVDPEQIKTNMRMGYLDTLKVLGNIGGNKYYFASLPAEKLVLRAISKITKKRKSFLANAITGNDYISERHFIERILPKLGRMLDSKINDGYTDLIVQGLEELLTEAKVDRLEVYNIHEALSFCKNFKFEERHNIIFEFINAIVEKII